MNLREPNPEKPRSWLRRIGDACDDVVAAVFPRLGYQRKALRRQWDALESRFPKNRGLEAAETNETRGDRWLAGRLSAGDILEEDLEDTRHRSRELYRSDSIGGAVDNRVNHVVGSTFGVQMRIPDMPDLNREIEDVISEWSLRVDPTFRRSLWQTLRLAERCHAVDGEAFIVISDVGDADKPIPLSLEVVDADRVQTPPEEASNPRIRLGIETNARGRIVAYHIRTQSPFDSKTDEVRFVRIPADRVCHVFEPWFAEQTRGIPWMARVLNRLKDVKDLDEANIIAAQIEASFAAFVKTGGGSPLQAAHAAANGSNSAGNRIQDIIPGAVHYLGRDEEVQFASPNRSGGNYEPFQRMNHKRVAAGMNWPYEMLMKDWDGVSHAGGRLALTDAKVDCMVRRRLLIELALIPITWRAIDEMVAVGAISLDPREYNARRSFYRKHQWMGPGWEYSINPVDEIAAESAAVAENFKTRAQVVAEKFGQDIEQVDAERARERARERELDIVPPKLAEADAAKNAAKSPEQVPAETSA